MTSRREFEERAERLLEEMGTVREMRRGTLTVRYLRCGSPGCHCGRPGSRGHGPKYSLTWKEKGKTKTEYIPAERVAEVEKQLANHERFVRLCQEWVEINEAVCRLRLEEEREAGKKTGGRDRRRDRERNRADGELDEEGLGTAGGSGFGSDGVWDSEAVGEAIRGVEEERGERIWSGKVGPCCAPAPEKIVYIAVDGTGVPVVGRETEGHPGKGEDGRARPRG